MQEEKMKRVAEEIRHQREMEEASKRRTKELHIEQLEAEREREEATEEEEAKPISSS